MTAEVSKKVFLDANSHLVDKVNNENMKELSLEERNKLQILAKMPTKQLKLELERSAEKLIEPECDSEIQVIKSSKENLETKLEQKATIIEKIRDEPTNNTKRIPTANNLPPELTSALEAGLISPTQLARLMAGELIDDPILGGKDKTVMHGDGKQTNKQTAPKESVEIDDIGEEKLEAFTISDEELATGWLDNDLLPSGWKLKIACDGKPSDEQVG